MTDRQKWALAIFIGALGGIVDTSAEKFPGWWSLTYHIAVGITTIVVPLKLTLLGK